MKTLGALLALAVIVYVWCRHARATVSPEWLVDHDRRQWGMGNDGVCWDWPVQKDGLDRATLEALKGTPLRDVPSRIARVQQRLH